MIEQCLNARSPSFSELLARSLNADGMAEVLIGKCAFVLAFSALPLRPSLSCLLSHTMSMVCMSMLVFYKIRVAVCLFAAWGFHLCGCFFELLALSLYNITFDNIDPLLDFFFSKLLARSISADGSYYIESNLG
jgi:hypothetical protein